MFTSSTFASSRRQAYGGVKSVSAPAKHIETSNDDVLNKNRLHAKASSVRSSPQSNMGNIKAFDNPSPHTQRLNRQKKVTESTEEVRLGRFKHYVVRDDRGVTRTVRIPEEASDTDRMECETCNKGFRYCVCSGSFGSPCTPSTISPAHSPSPTNLNLTMMLNRPPDVSNEQWFWPDDVSYDADDHSQYPDTDVFVTVGKKFGFFIATKNRFPPLYFSRNLATTADTKAEFRNKLQRIKNSTGSISDIDETIYGNNPEPEPESTWTGNLPREKGVKVTLSGRKQRKQTATSEREKPKKLTTTPSITIVDIDVGEELKTASVPDHKQTKEINTDKRLVIPAVHTGKEKMPEILQQTKLLSKD